ncbi:G-type lectin S-receptor-like serine/threonine-protein kinase [Acorus gramineus]|uniref:G-type lectin S-receptor-like serine/threonine-protein kinase n=1 Tax=Acorus gramineus TaxID=55184 RepID=A0AAV9AAF0_ACOGR|nr:G-type lectin S-receptor-like serine/threonine-protein kinase [Acorus gramineus]
MVVKGVKVPDTSGAVVDGEMVGLRECKTACLRNCLCAGYGAKDVREGVGGCVMWFGDLVDVRSYAEGGQDLYVRVSASEIDSTERSPGERTAAAAVVLKEPPATVAVVGIVMLLLGVSIYFILERRINAKRLETAPHSLESETTRARSQSSQDVNPLDVTQVLWEGGRAEPFSPIAKGTRAKIHQGPYCARVTTLLKIDHTWQSSIQFK